MPKFSPSFMVSGGISGSGPGKLIFVTGNQDSYAYEKILRYYKEDIDFLQGKKNKEILFQQDNAPNHTSSKSRIIINDLFFTKPELTEEEKQLKEPGKVPSKAKSMSKEQYEDLKRQYAIKQLDFEEKKKNLEQSRLNIPKNKIQKLLLNWPANSPVSL